MIIRGFSHRDINQLERIHKDHYGNEFPLDEFRLPNFLGSFSVVDDNDNLISTGGVRTIAEVVIVTDKDQPVKTRREALLKMLQASSYFASNSGHNQLHAFVQDETWKQQLIRRGFRKTKGTSLYYPI